MAQPMGYMPPTIEDLRRQAALLGVSPTDEDLARVQGFLTVLLPQFDELERLVEADSVPAAVFRPEIEERE
jgi:hypothetical protein